MWIGGCQGLAMLTAVGNSGGGGGIRIAGSFVCLERRRGWEREWGVMGYMLVCVSGQSRVTGELKAGQESKVADKPI